MQFEEDEGLERLRQDREEVAPRDEPPVTRREFEPEVQGRLCEELIVFPLPPEGLCGGFLIYGAFELRFTPDLTTSVDRL